MSKQTKTIEVDICDFCDKKEAGLYNCITCKKTACYLCSTKHMVEYSDGIYSRSGKSGHYCLACDKKHKADYIDPLWIAYYKIRNEQQALAEADNLNIARAKKLEAELSGIYSQYFPSNH